jgi:hypothetical protein
MGNKFLHPGMGCHFLYKNLWVNVRKALEVGGDSAFYLVEQGEHLPNAAG